jgi:hypothetical protein
MSMATPNLTTLLMGGTIAAQSARKRSIRIDDDDLHRLISEKHGYHISKLAKINPQH